MKALRTILILVLSLVLAVPVFAKGAGHGGRSRSSSHTHFSHVSKKSHKSGSHDGQYVGGHGSSHEDGH
jgi:hypothetical protein